MKNIFRIAALAFAMVAISPGISAQDKLTAPQQQGENKPKPNPNPKPKPNPDSRQRSTTPSTPAPKPVDTYINVDARVAQFPPKPKGATRTFNIKTDAYDWDIESWPYFINIVDRTGSSFIVTCDDNIGEDRTGEIVITTDKNTARIEVKQGSGIGAVINKVWLEVDAVRDGYQGMVIHLDVDATGLNGHEIRGNAYFENGDGTKLYDMDQNYGTAEGQVSTGNTYKAQFDEQHWSDFEMFIPYDQLHLGTGDFRLKFYVQFFDLYTGQYLAGTKKQTFSFSRH